MPKVGVLLAGCGVFDGSELHEAVITLLELDKAGAEAVCIAPNMDQLHVIDHISGEEMQQKRNVLVESARIARGNIQDIATTAVDDIDALIIPGGFGVAKNLFDYAIAGVDCKVNPAVEQFIQQAHKAGRPIGAICIAPTLLAKCLADNIELTIGNDASTAEDIRKFGGKHIECAVDDIVIDENKKVVSTPAYMQAKSIKEAAAGIAKLVQQVLQMI